MPKASASSIHKSNTKETSGNNSLRNIFYRVFKIGRVSTRDLAVFASHFSLLLSSGVDIVTTLDILKGDDRHRRFQKNLDAIIKLIQSGRSISDAFSRFPASFTPFFISMLKTGELGGSLDKILSDLSSYYEEEADFKDEFIQILLYPIIVLCISLAVITFLLVSVVPVFVSIFESMGSDIPLLTRILLHIGTLIKYLLPMILLCVIFLFLAFRLSPKNGKLIRLRDKLLLRIPVIGKTIYYFECLRFAKALAILQDRGIEIIVSLQIVSDVIQNIALRSVFLQACDRVKQGMLLSESLKMSQIIQNDFYQILRVGENSGSMGTALNNIAGHYSAEGKRRLKIIMTIFEPLVLVLVGLVVMFIILSIMMPIYQIYNGYADLI